MSENFSAKIYRKSESGTKRAKIHTIVGKPHARAATKRGGRGPARPSQGLARMNVAANQQRTYVYARPQLNRLKEHKTFDGNIGASAAGALTLAQVFSTANAVAATPFNFNTAGNAWCINQVPLGNSSITRVGRRFANTAISLRGSVQAGSTTATAKCALVLVWDRNPNSGANIPSFPTVFANSGANTPMELTNKDNAPRFKILRRWVWTVIGNNTTAGQQTEKTIFYFDEFVKMKNKITLLTAADTTGLITDMVEGSLLLYAMGDQAAGTTAPGLTMQTRLYYEDN